MSIELLSQVEIDDILHASREADEGPTALARRIEAAVMGRLGGTIGADDSETVGNTLRPADAYRSWLVATDDPERRAKGSETPFMGGWYAAMRVSRSTAALLALKEASRLGEPAVGASIARRIVEA